jgi:hypothetical protein
MTLGKIVCTRQLLHLWWVLTSGIEHVATKFPNFTSNERNIRNPILGNEESDVEWKGLAGKEICGPKFAPKRAA